jgi:hypothetical protein
VPTLFHAEERKGCPENKISALPIRRRIRINILNLTPLGVSMHKFVIERGIPGVGKMTPAQLQTVSRRSINVLAELGVDIQWV